MQNVGIKQNIINHWLCFTQAVMCGNELVQLINMADAQHLTGFLLRQELKILEPGAFC